MTTTLAGTYTLDQVLAACAAAPAIACLAGHQGVFITWSDDPVAWTTAMPQACGNHAATATEALPTVGTTWTWPALDASIIQCDYEWPQQSVRCLPVRQAVHLDPQGNLSIIAADTATAESIARLFRHTGAVIHPAQLATPLQPQWTVATYQQRLARIRTYIAAGDCYQVNLTLPFQAQLQPTVHQDLAAFLALHTHSPAPYAACFRIPGQPSIVSHSPECFFSVRDRQIVSVPIKGTRRRQPGHDAHVRAELHASSKDAAELAMIVDLVRNDIGRIAQRGSVRVDDRQVDIDLDYVHHRAARISGQRRDDADVSACLIALFPAGSITGAPKIRAMDIIRELEMQPRGPAYGTFGWSNGTDTDLAVAIRTALITDNQVQFHAGGGIVWDSDATAEWHEVHAKAAGFARALGGSCSAE